jgi:2-desacetyl-2-hydroxyethyl bacteriochlorophyllide A dehydrogenase
MSPATTRALWFTAKEKAELRDEKIDSCGPGQITVQALASAVSHGTEMTIFHGQAPSATTVLDLPQDLIQPQETMGGSFGQRFPIKYAYASVGRVIDAAPGTPFRPGDHVFVRAPHQEFYTVRAELAFRIPEWNPLDIGTQMALLDVAVNAIMDVPVTLGEIVAVYGQGAVGLYTAQLARRTAGTLIVVDPVPERRAMGLRFGADIAVDPAEALTAIKDASAGRGADISIEISGSTKALQTAIQGTAAEGTISVPGYYGLRPLELVLSPEFHMRRLQMVSSSANAVAARLLPRWTIERRLGVVADVLPKLHPEEIISARVPFDEAPRAYQMLQDNPTGYTSIVFTYPEH